MGLPIWRAPSPEPQDALKANLTAPARSPIRRRRPPISASSRSPRLDFALNALSRVSDADSSRSSHSRPHFPPAPVPESRNYSLWGFGPGYTQPEHARASVAYEESLSRPQHRAFADPNHPQSSDDRRALPSLTPNFAPAAASRSARNDSARNARERRRHRTLPWARPGEYAPPRNGPRGPDGSMQGGATDVDEEGSGESGNSNAVGFPPLRRMGRRHITDGPLPSSSLRESWSPASTVDGLGDRERSMSPVEDNWETMLSSVAPDPLAPTADSSFTSAAASASFSASHPSSRAGSSNSNSAASSRTHLTVPSRRQSFTFDQFLRICDTSDDNSASDTEEDEADPQPNSASQRRRSAARPAVYDPPQRNPHRLSRGVQDRSRESTAYVRSFYGEIAPPPEARLLNQPGRPLEDRPTSDDDLTLEQELREARVLIERLQRRDDVSEEFWASVGLRRPLADGVERMQQRDRS